MRVNEIRERLEPAAIAADMLPVCFAAVRDYFSLDTCGVHVGVNVNADRAVAVKGTGKVLVPATARLGVGHVTGTVHIDGARAYFSIVPIVATIQGL